jgi:hypothetical protein
MKEKAVAFLGSLVPDNSEFDNIALRRSGNMVQDGIVCGLYEQNVDMIVFSLQPRASFPQDRKMFYKGRKIKYKERIYVYTVPFVNIVVLKTFCCFVVDFFCIVNWAIKKRNKDRFIMVYNTYTPPLPFIYLMGKLTKSKSVAILYDLGMPPKQLKLNLFKRSIYRCVEWSAKHFIPAIDGRIVINDAIGEDYGQGKHYILIDGGIGDDVINRLFYISERGSRKETFFLFAGSISPINGTRLIGEVLKINKNPLIKILFAGSGHDLEYIKQLQYSDNRVKYVGNLNLDELFSLYENVDVLLNLRIIDKSEKYLFPSKILEYLTIGKLVLSTSVGHICQKYGEFCRVLSENTPQALSDEMNYLTTLTSEELIMNGIISRDFMLENCTWNKQSMKIYEYIKTI